MWARHALAALAWACCCVSGAHAACGVAQFPCRAARCVPLSAYCDGTPHCPDGSDEPPGCTPCNRTYYGLTGRAYELTLGAPARLPFLCQLTFTAGGGALGDLVQLGFERFVVGRYSAGAREPCPDGAAQLAELGRPFTGGSWCGEAAGPALYYSETATVTLSLRLAAGALALRLRYRFLAAREAVVRFGPAAAPVERGAAAPGTYCTRTYEECHRRACRLQSPNYPGMYPRNVTCYWSLRQKDVPTCKHAMISVRQDHAHKMQIKRSISMASLNKTGRAVRAWRECTGERDRLIVYDGGSTDDPVLLEYCGGDWLPPVTSRGPDMLVAFHSSPYSAPPRAPSGGAALGLRGFELDVAVVFADSDSLEYAREPRRCEFHVKAGAGDEEGGAGRGRRGVLRAPRHTLPPGAACTWTFHGRPGDQVWLYFASYTHYSLVEPRREISASDDHTELPFDAVPRGQGAGDASPGAAAGAEAAPGRSDSSPWARLRELMRSRAGTSPAPTTAAPASCDTELRIWDGPAEGAVPLARYCDTAPALCARASLANATRAPRACAPPDGYVSHGAVMSLALRTLRGTATHPLRFALHYEFVDARLPGALLEADAGASSAVPRECARELAADGALWAPRAVLWLGRGGARRLRCVYRLVAGVAREARLRLGQVTLGREPRCSTRLDARTGLLACAPHLPVPAGEVKGDPDLEELPADMEPPLQVPHLWIYESPWPGVKVPVACVCDNTSAPLETRGAGSLELRFGATRLLADEDQRHLQFNGSWSASGADSACLPLAPPPPGGHVHLPPAPCARAVLLRARAGRSVFLRVWGEELPPPAAAAAPQPSESPPCATQDRVLVYEPHSGRLLKAICPGDTSEAARTVQLFSAEWWGGAGMTGAAGAAGDGGWLAVQVSARAAPARLAWLEVRRAETLGDNVTCPHACAELGACADAALWCDGAADCPRGGDEAGGCGAARLLAVLAGWQAGAAAGAGAAALLLLLLVLALRRARSRKRPPDAAPRRLTQEPLLDSRPASAAS